MTFSAILTPVSDDKRTDPHLSAAVMLARAYRAQLIGSAAEFYMPQGMAMMDVGGVIAVAETTVIEADLKQAAAKFKAACAGLEPPARMLTSIETPVEALCRHSALADLVVIGDMPRDQSDIFRFIGPGEAILRTGRPVLRIPTSGMAMEPKTVAIAWKNTREARRAAADALPFLQRAETVLVFEALEWAQTEQPTSDVKDVLAYLCLRGIKATGVTIPYGVPAGDEILLAAARAGADLIVAGAYGHSRMEEWIFGGVTKHLLDHATVPVLFSR